MPRNSKRQSKLNGDQQENLILENEKYMLRQKMWSYTNKFRRKKKDEKCSKIWQTVLFVEHHKIACFGDKLFATLMANIQNQVKVKTVNKEMVDLQQHIIRR